MVLARDLFACTLAAEVMGPKIDGVIDEMASADHTISTVLAIIGKMKRFMDAFWTDENRFNKPGVDYRARNLTKTIDNVRYPPTFPNYEHRGYDTVEGRVRFDIMEKKERARQKLAAEEKKWGGASIPTKSSSSGSK